MSTTTIQIVGSVVAALLGGGGLIALLKWRPEATSSSVLAAAEAVEIVRGELVRLKAEVAELRAELRVVQEARIAAERDAAQWQFRYEAEHEAHMVTKQELAAAKATLHSTAARRTGDGSIGDNDG